MKSSRSALFLFSISLLLLFVSGTLPACSQEIGKQEKLDQQVKNFLESSKNNWRDMNVPESDGQLLYDIIIENSYTRAVEIGTSTGHSGIWIAWALSKTGGNNQSLKSFGLKPGHSMLCSVAPGKSGGY